VNAVSPVLVIGIGHPDRGDDAIGRIVAGRLRRRAPAGMTVLDLDGEATGLLAHLAGADSAILVDAALSAEPPGTIRRFDAAAGPLPPSRSGVSSHGLGPGEAIELARALNCLPRRCIVFAVTGADFAVGASLSAGVAAAIDGLIARVLAEAGVAAHA
jgi:hydrogenase maturation protease